MLLAYCPNPSYDYPYLEAGDIIYPIGYDYQRPHVKEQSLADSKYNEVDQKGQSGILK